MQKFLRKLGKQLNIVKQCQELNVDLWSCPQFLFVIMGSIIIGSILITYNVAQRYAEAEIVALVVIALTVFLFVVSYVIVSAFEKVVHARRMEARQAKDLIALKDQFVFLAAHELKVPAIEIQLGLQQLESKHDDFFEKERDVVTKIKESNYRLLALVQDLLEVARIEGEIIHIELSEVSIEKAYRDAVKELENMARTRGVEVTADVAPDLPMVRADGRRLKEVLINFLSNAIKYSDPKNGKVSIKAVDFGKEVVISVSNNGPGIESTDQKHIFEKFWRSKEAQKSAVRGTGLGLFIVKQLVKLMEGRTWFTSEPDKTVFYAVFKKASLKNKQEEA